MKNINKMCHNKHFFVFQQFTLGIASLSKLGWAGATLEAFLILYLHAASLTGLSTPLRALRVLPRARRTPLTRIIALCAVLLAHSTAQPLLVKILGTLLYCSSIDGANVLLKSRYRSDDAVFFIGVPNQK